jgi:hypothetical protein
MEEDGSLKSPTAFNASPEINSSVALGRWLKCEPY